MHSWASSRMPCPLVLTQYAHNHDAHLQINYQPGFRPSQHSIPPSFEKHATHVVQRPFGRVRSQGHINSCRVRSLQHSDMYIQCQMILMINVRCRRCTMMMLPIYLRLSLLIDDHGGNTIYILQHSHVWDAEDVRIYEGHQIHVRTHGFNGPY